MKLQISNKRKCHYLLLEICMHTDTYVRLDTTNDSLICKTAFQISVHRSQEDLLIEKMIRPGLEPGTFCVLDRCDNQLRHRTLRNRVASGSIVSRGA